MENDIEGKALKVAETTLELMYDTVDWVMEDNLDDGDTYNAIHNEVLVRAIALLDQMTTK